MALKSQSRKLPLLPDGAVVGVYDETNQLLRELIEEVRALRADISRREEESAG